MYFNQNNNFYHGIMFHHFHDNGLHTQGQGSINKDHKLLRGVLLPGAPNPVYLINKVN